MYNVKFTTGFATVSPLRHQKIPNASGNSNSSCSPAVPSSAFRLEGKKHGKSQLNLTFGWMFFWQHYTKIRKCLLRYLDDEKTRKQRPNRSNHPYLRSRPLATRPQIDRNTEKLIVWKVTLWGSLILSHLHSLVTSIIRFVNFRIVGSFKAFGGDEFFRFSIQLQPNRLADWKFSYMLAT